MANPNKKLIQETTIVFRVDDELKKYLKKKAKQEGINTSELIRRLVLKDLHEQITKDNQVTDKKLSKNEIHVRMTYLIEELMKIQDNIK